MRPSASITAYTQQSSFVEGKFVYNQIEGYIQDNWRVNNKLTLDYGVRLTHQQPQYDANGQASNFFLDQYSRAAAPVQYVPGCPGNVFPCEATRQAMNPQTGQLMGAGTAALIGQIVPNTGNLTNGIVRAGDGISKYNYEWPTLTAAPRFGAAYSVKDDQSLVVRGGIGLFYDRPDGDSIYYQSQNPPTSTNQTVRNGQLQTLGTGTAVASLGRADAHQLPVRQSAPSASLQWNVGTQMVMPFATALDVSYVGQHASHVHRVPVAVRHQHQRRRLRRGVPADQPGSDAGAVGRRQARTRTSRSCCIRSAATRTSTSNGRISTAPSTRCSSR